MGDSEGPFILPNHVWDRHHTCRDSKCETDTYTDTFYTFLDSFHWHRIYFFLQGTERRQRPSCPEYMCNLYDRMKADLLKYGLKNLGQVGLFSSWQMIVHITGTSWSLQCLLFFCFLCPNILSSPGSLLKPIRAKVKVSGPKTLKSSTNQSYAEARKEPTGIPPPGTTIAGFCSSETILLILSLQ